MWHNNLQTVSESNRSRIKSFGVQNVLLVITFVFITACARVCMCVCVCVRACVRACVRQNQTVRG